ncbi:MAG: immune inhibitor A [Bdellovibrionales bacterium]|nr:immune inhibitor A [Bdellovibrionales bacterium]
MKSLSVLIGVLFFVTACSQSTNRSQLNHNDKVIYDLQSEVSKLSTSNDPKDIERSLYLEKMMNEKRTAKTLVSANVEKMRQSMKGHSDLYVFEGNYKVLVIPVQFKDVKFDNPDFYPQALGAEAPIQEYLFGNNPDSMTSFYKHTSFGKFTLTGEVAPIITVDKNLIEYGEAVFGNNDKNARGLVIDTLQKLKDMGVSSDWWESFDNWDLFDYDQDNHFSEPDGFIDAVILVFAGKAQSSCQRSFDPEGTRPPSDSVPQGPRHDATVECYNRIWPHRWTISVPSSDPRYSVVGPTVEGVARPSLNGFKLSDSVFALDYNMQAEYSEVSTLIHEFGHSLTLPDIYAYRGDNNTGGWDAMSSTATVHPQEFSSYSKLALGWLRPKIIQQGQNTSAYLGHYNYVSQQQRETGLDYSGPSTVDENVGDEIHTYDVVSTTPGFKEPVYRSLAIMTEPSKELEQVIVMPSEMQTYTAYSGRFDGTSKSLNLHFKVPENAKTISFDTIYHIETETNFDSKESQIRVVTDYDIGGVYLNSKLVDELRTISGDSNSDTLAEANPECDTKRALELRGKKIADTITESEKEEFKKVLEICQKPVWVKKSYDVTAYAGKDLHLEVRYTTDAGYTEFGIFVDNVSLGKDVVDFESQPVIDGGFTLLADGKKENFFNQFYLLEFRDPKTDYIIDQQELSYNLDRNIEILWKQSMFIDKGASLMERFRMVEMEQQPGVLAWYFNTKYDTRSNIPEFQEGKGYLLVVNPRVQEVLLPDVLSSPILLDADGDYKGDKDSDYKAFEKAQRELFGCFAHSRYYEYVEGALPICPDEAERDSMLGLSFEGKPLIYRREAFNDILPIHQTSYSFVGEPLRTEPEMRTGLSTFRPASWGDFSPFKIYKADKGKMVLDQELTSKAFKSPSTDVFMDAKNALHPKERFRADNVLVEKKGLVFKVVDPSPRIEKLYNSKTPDSNDNIYRKPQVKVLVEWR